MNKFVSIILLLFCFAGYGFAQQTIEYCKTYYYKNGVKIKLKKPGFIYITFMDDYTRFYISDEYGDCIKFNMDNSPRVFVYQKSESNYNEYKLDMPLDGGRLNVLEIKWADKYKFSKDFSLLNIESSVGRDDVVGVYKRVSEAEKEAILREYEEGLPKLLE